MQAACLLVAALQEDLIDCQLVPDLVLRHNSAVLRPAPQLHVEDEAKPTLRPTLASSNTTMGISGSTSLMRPLGT